MVTTLKQSDSSAPRYREIEEVLYERIRCGKLRPGERLDSTEALAQQLDVGLGTVNQALSALASRGLLTRRPRVGTVVSEGVRDIIGRDANASPRETAIYAVLVPDLRIPAFSGMVHHLQEILSKERVHVSVFNIEGGGVGEVIGRCVDDGVDAMLMVPPLFDEIPMEVLVRLRDSGIPVVMCWRSVGIPEWPLVQGSPRDVFAKAARHLLDKGCRRIAMLRDQLLPDPSGRPAIEPMGVDVDPSAQLEFVHALAEYDLVVKPKDLACVNHGVDALQPGGLAGQGRVIDALVDWFRERPDIDGVLCTYDIVAGLVLEALDRLGRKVPEDVAVTGGGSLSAYSWYFAASLTSIDPDLPSVARRACDLLERLRQGEHIEPGHVEHVDCLLVEGESTARK